MDGSHYDLTQDLIPGPPPPWWGRRLDAARGVALMLAVAVVTFAAIILLDGRAMPVADGAAPVVMGAL